MLRTISAITHITLITCITVSHHHPATHYPYPPDPIHLTLSTYLPPTPQANDMARSWVQRVSRTPMPVGSIDRYATKVDVHSQKALHGCWCEKKLHGNMFRASRFMWIDHLTKSLHWSRTNDKLSPHKALKLDSVLKIGECRP